MTRQDGPYTMYRNGDTVAVQQPKERVYEVARDLAEPASPVQVVREQGGERLLLATFWSDGGIDFTPEGAKELR